VTILFVEFASIVAVLLPGLHTTNMDHGPARPADSSPRVVRMVRGISPCTQLTLTAGVTGGDDRAPEGQVERSLADELHGTMAFSEKDRVTARVLICRAITKLRIRGSPPLVESSAESAETVTSQPPPAPRML
jgi:hypothetical protein